MNKKSSGKMLKPLEKCTKAEAGTKGYNLKLLSKIKGVLIPETLCIPTKYFDEIKALNISESRLNFSTFKFPDEFTSALLEQIDERFGARNLVIRSSATCEDTPFLSFAGNYSSFLNISGKKQILRAIKLCYLSMFNENAKVYAERGKVNLTRHRMAILIQPVAPVKQAGVMFTTNPVTLNKREIVIELVDGLGDKMVDGSTRPKTIILPIQSRQTGSDHLLKSLAQLGKKIEKSFKRPQDLEWGILKDRSIIFFQSRPITVMKIPTQHRWKNLELDTSSGKLLSRGIGASIGTAVGRLHCIRETNDLQKITGDTILYFESKVDLQFLQHLPKIRGMIINGGMLSHIAVIARELRIPLIAGISNGLANFDDTMVAIDGGNGLIYQL